MILAAIALTALVAAAGSAAADDWPFFRGPHRNGVSDETGWQTAWPESGPVIAWRANVGIGVSSFAVVPGRVVTMGNRDDHDVVTCLDPDTGNVLWEFSYPCKFDDRNFSGGTASTPTIDGDRVYVLSYDGRFHCLGLEDGRPVWTVHLVEDLGGRYSSWKYAGSPLVIGDLVILDTGADGGSTVALDRMTGGVVWASGDDLAGYSTPIPLTYHGEPAVVVFKARAMIGLDLADGRELFRIPWKAFYDCNASSPAALGQRLFISTGYGRRSGRGALFDLSGESPAELWMNDDIETKINSAVVYDGHVYAISEARRGQLMCVDLADGKTVWADDRFFPYGTLMVAGGRLVILGEYGDLFIAEASPSGYTEIAKAQLFDERCWVMPVLANGRLYARTNAGDVVCVDLRPGSYDE